MVDEHGAGRGVEAALVEKRKHPHVVRATFEAQVLGQDSWGEWLRVPRQRAVLLLPWGQWWVAWFRREGTLRVDVATAVAPGAETRSFVDLDLDVEREADGTVHILDEDEFAERCDAYPPSWVPVALRTVREVADRARRYAEPFGTAHHRWMPAQVSTAGTGCGAGGPT